MTANAESCQRGSTRVWRRHEKAREGVRVRVIFDSIGSRHIDPRMLTRMRNAGVQLLEYHPVAPWRARWVSC